jgi:two-component system, cell cycle sensor histidine kinase and response regulator CckA
MPKSPTLVVVKTCGLYTVIAGLWILLSDRALALLVPDPELALALQTWKGWAFVAVTAGILFVAMRRQLVNWNRETEGNRDELARERMFLTALMDTLPDYIYFKDRESRFLLTNRAFADAVGVDDPVLVAGKTDFDYLVEASARAAFQIEQEIIRTGQPVFEIEERAAWYGGREIWVLSTKMPLRDRTGAIIGVFGISRDHTQKKEAEQALRQSEERFRGLFLNAPFGIFHSTTAGKEIDVNPAQARIFGYESPEKMIEAVNRRTIHEIMFENPADRARMVEEVLRAGTWRRFENVRYRRRDGGKIVLTVTMRPFRRHDGDEVELEGFIEDVTEREHAAEERRRFEEQLLQSQKMEAVGRLAGGIAHDFNNLLTVISGYSDLALELTGPADQVRGALGEIGAAARRAASLTSQLLAFSRRQILQPRLTDLDELVSRMVDMLQRLLGEDIELRTLRGGGLWPVRADPGKLEQVVMNLAVNARDAMPNGGTLTLETSNVRLDEDYARSHVEVAAGEYMLLTVSDTGQGMDVETLGRIFEPFFTTKEKGKGTGLGLATVYGIVRQSGGHISCTSRKGEGTTFRIYLPRAAGAAESAAADGTAEQPAGGKEPVLLVEDDEMVRKFSSQVLARAGYRVVSARDGNEALLALDTEGSAIRLIITDVVMPVMDGRTLAREALRRFPGLPVLYLSGYTEDAIVSHGILEEGVQLLQKPFAPGELLRRVRAVLDGTPAPDGPR